MTDLRESVARAVKECREHVAASQDEAADIIASRALRAVADAGFVIVPREATADMCEHGSAINEGAEPLPAITTSQADACWNAMIRAAVAAALKEMGAG